MAHRPCSRKAQHWVSGPGPVVPDRRRPLSGGGMGTTKRFQAFGQVGRVGAAAGFQRQGVNRDVPSSTTRILAGVAGAFKCCRMARHHGVVGARRVMFLHRKNRCEKTIRTLFITIENPRQPCTGDRLVSVLKRKGGRPKDRGGNARGAACREATATPVRRCLQA